MIMRPRREFSPLTKRLAYARSKDVCECHRVPQLPTFGIGCGRPLSEGNTFYEHIVCDNLGGDNDIANCAVLCRTCWRAKSYEYDLPVIAQAKRRNDRSRGIKPFQWKPLAGTKASGIKKPLVPFSEPVDRRTGLPWRGW